LIVACPHCSTRYELSESLLGPGGARVRCPRCRGAFLVGRDGRVEAAPADAAPAPSPAPAAAAPAAGGAAPAAGDERSPLGEARAVLAALAASHGAALDDAAARGRLFSEHGQRLMEAFDAWRARAGRGSDPEPFRRALRERWGVDLTPPGDDEGSPVA